MDALESVREQIQRVVMQGELNQELGDDGDAFRFKMREFRDEARRESARAELDQLKSEFDSHTLPPEAVSHIDTSLVPAPAAS